MAPLHKGDEKSGYRKGFIIIIFVYRGLRQFMSWLLFYMDTSSIYKGTITYFSLERHFGFIDSDFQEGIFFFVDTKHIRQLSKIERQDIKSKFLRGDEVYFKIKQSSRGFEAYDLKFIKNERIEQFKTLVESNNELVGFLKKIGDDYFAKDKITYIFIPVEIMEWAEDDIESVYEKRLNKEVRYTIVNKTAKPEKWKAILTDRLLNDDFKKLYDYQKDKTELTATITGKNKFGFFATIMDNKIGAFIPTMKEESVSFAFNKWDTVKVTIKSVHKGGVQIEPC